MIFPFFPPQPKISLQGDLRLSKWELQSNWLSTNSLEDGKVQSKLERYGPIFIFLHNPQLMRIEIEIGELSFKHKGLIDDMFGVICGLKW